MPSTAWLEQMVAQILSAREDAQPLVEHPDVDVRRHRDQLHLVPRSRNWPACAIRTTKASSSSTPRRSAGTAKPIAFPDYGGVLHFDTAPRGFDPAWLREQGLEIDFRKGGERLRSRRTVRRAASSSCSRQAACRSGNEGACPSSAAGFDLLFAAGLGMDCRHVTEGEGRIALRWESATATIPG
jgi:tRNA(Ile)-lysidine synthase